VIHGEGLGQRCACCNVVLDALSRPQRIRSSRFNDLCTDCVDAIEGALFEFERVPETAPEYNTQ
jgi:hypothetical protein